MKKLLVIVSVIVFVLTLASCNGQTEAPAGTSAPDVTEAPEITEPVVTEPVDTEPPETQHVHSYKSSVEAATCTRQGKTTKVCDCGDTKIEVIPMLRHTPSAVSCEKDTVCTVCNTVLAPKTGHQMVSKNVITEPTCSLAGKEKAACSLCNYTTEREIPSYGHVLAADGDISAFGDGYIIKCDECGKKVIVKESEPILKLTFDNPVEAEAEGNSLGFEPVKADTWKIQEFNGSKALYVNGATYYINVPDADVFADIGTFMISFDYMSTAEGNDTDKASVVSFLNNCYSGAKTEKGAIGWGWLIKLIEAEDVISTSLDCDSSNSIALERNKNYNIKIIIVPTAKVAHVYVDGTYIGFSSQLAAISTMGQRNLCIRFGDGPKCGHVIDNFVICDLK